jgi:hypothetical protein
MKFTMLFGRSSNRSCYASPVFVPQATRFDAQFRCSYLYNARMLGGFPGFVTATQRSCVISGTKNAMSSIASDLSA